MEQPGPKSILLVEDDEMSNKILCSMLGKKFPATEIYLAVNGNEGLDLFLTHLPEIVISDISMPGMDGVQMIDRIAAVKPDTRIIVVTAHREKHILKRVSASGAGINLVYKPINFEALFASIEQCAP